MESKISSLLSNSTVTVVDYGMGNLWSVTSALSYLNANFIVSDQPDVVASADALLLPGVGSFGKAMKMLKENMLDQAILEATLTRGRKILGICLGMQLMGIDSTEDGVTQGLGLISAKVEKFSPHEVGMKKIPHVGFDSVVSPTGSKLFSGISEDSDFYFVHSYRMLPENLMGFRSTCDYGVNFLAAYEYNNIFATQFHPEKSQTNGLMLIKNFLSAS